MGFRGLISTIAMVSVLCIQSMYAQQQPAQATKDSATAPGINLGAKASVKVDARADVQAGISMSPLDNLRSKVFLGVGVGYNLPMSTGLRDNNSASIGGHLILGSNNFCNVWPMLRLGAIPWSRTSENFPTYYRWMIDVSPEVRWFPWGCSSSLPVYVSGQLSVGTIGGSDNAGRIGFGGGANAGILLFHPNNCASWFVDANVRYHAPNLLIKSSMRPVLSAVTLSLTFNIAL